MKTLLDYEFVFYRRALLALHTASEHASTARKLFFQVPNSKQTVAIRILAKMFECDFRNQLKEEEYAQAVSQSFPALNDVEIHPVDNWVNARLLLNKKTVVVYLKQFNCFVVDLQSALIGLLDLLGIQNDRSEQFFTLMEDKYKSSFFAYEVPDFVEGFQEWAVMNLKGDTFKATGVETSRNTLSKFRHLLPGLSEIEGVKQKHLESKNSKGNLTALRIFEFYAKSDAHLRKKPTFDEIEINNSTLSSAKFMKFCKNFGFISKLNLVSTKDLIAIFKKLTNNTLLMNFWQFKKALELIAQEYYGPKYDMFYKTAYAKEVSSVKVKLLYEYLVKYQAECTHPKEKYLPRLKRRELFNTPLKSRIERKSIVIKKEPPKLSLTPNRVRLSRRKELLIR